MLILSRFSGERHDMMTPEDMIAALNSNGGVKDVFASFIAVDQTYEVKTKEKIPNILSSLNNFDFLANGVSGGKACEVGQGQCYQLIDRTFQISLKRFKV